MNGRFPVGEELQLGGGGRGASLARQLVGRQVSQQLPGEGVGRGAADVAEVAVGRAGTDLVLEPALQGAGVAVAEDGVGGETVESAAGERESHSVGREFHSIDMISHDWKFNEVGDIV